jgi:hypothetical protein
LDRVVKAAAFVVSAQQVPGPRWTAGMPAAICAQATSDIQAARTGAQKAQNRIAHARRRPGFREEPDCFLVNAHTLDEDQWTEGFVATPAERIEPFRWTITGVIRDQS